MNKFKLFMSNILIYGFGGIISKLIPLIMVPVVTRLMPNSSYYALSDLSNTIVSLASAIAIFGMSDAMYRMFFEKDDLDYKQSICSTTLFFTLCLSTIVFVIMLLSRNYLSVFFFGDSSYGYLIIFSAFATLIGATNNIVSAPTRMQNKRSVFLITNSIIPIISFGMAIPLLINGYYTTALPFSRVIAFGVIEISFIIMNHNWFSLKKLDFKKLKPLLLIALPLFPNFLIYWLFNSCDRVMITNLMTVGAAGIYAVGAKLGQCSQLIYTAFAGGWQYFSFSTMKEKDQVQSNSRIFEYLGIISFVVTSFICALSYWIFKIAFTDEYLEGFIVAPYLFLAPLLQMLFQVACNQFIIIKKTWPNALILSVGAVVNILLNLCLIPVLGIEGAAIASLIGYIISVVICTLVLIHMKLMVVSLRFVISIATFLIHFLSWRFLYSTKGIIGCLAALIVTGVIGFMYRQDILELLNILKNMKKKK